MGSVTGGPEALSRVRLFSAIPLPGGATVMSLCKSFGVSIPAQGLGSMKARAIAIVLN